MVGRPDVSDEQKLRRLREMVAEAEAEIGRGEGFTFENEAQLTAFIAELGRRASDRVDAMRKTKNR